MRSQPANSPQAVDPVARRRAILDRIAACLPAGAAPEAFLLAVSKTRSAAEVRLLAAAGQVSFGENYVQEAVAKQSELSDLPLEWHLIGPLQSNKCQQAARNFDWIHSVDRIKLVPLLARARAADAAPLNLLLQVNIDDEDSKSGCAPAQLDALAEAVRREPALRLRGLMAIPAPHPQPERRRDAFHRMRQLFVGLQSRHPMIDTLSMGMSDDFELALAEGSSLVRIGTALFGARARATASIDAAQGTNGTATAPE